MKLETVRTPGYRAGLKRIIEKTQVAQSERFKEATTELEHSGSDERFEAALKAVVRAQARNR